MESRNQNEILRRRRPFFSGYTDHMLNFYVSTLTGAEQETDIDRVYFKSDVDRQNWLACDRLFKELGKTERSIIYIMHSTKPWERASTAEHVAEVYNMPVQQVWKTEYRIQHMLAVERGLIAECDLKKGDTLYV